MASPYCFYTWLYTFTWLQLCSHGYNGLLYFSDLTFVKIVQ